MSRRPSVATLFPYTTLFRSHSRNTSGMAYGNGCVWMGANAAPEGIFQVDMNSKELSHRQIPLSIDNNGGGCHGVKWHERSEEHTSELQSRRDLVCRLLLEKK